MTTYLSTAEDPGMSTGHTDWCARDHRCALGEHRADPITFTVPGAGSAVLTRIRSAAGTEHAEIRISVVLPVGETAARGRLAALLSHLRTLIGPPRTPTHPADRPHRRVA